MSEEIYTSKAAIFRKNWDLMKARHKKLRKLYGLDKSDNKTNSAKVNNTNFAQALFTATMLQMMNDEMFF